MLGYVTAALGAAVQGRSPIYATHRSQIAELHNTHSHIRHTQMLTNCTAHRLRIFFCFFKFPPTQFEQPVF